MIELTRAEQEVMEILWDLEKGFVKEIVAKYPDPKPAYNTVSTIIRILEKKKVVGHEAFGRTYRYFPILSKEDYTRTQTSNVINKLFSGSVQDLISYFVKEKDISTEELEEILKQSKNK